MTRSHRIPLSAALLLAVLPLAGCGNKGPLILAPAPPEGAPPAAMPAEGESVAPPSSSTVAPPPEPTAAPPSEAPQAQPPSDDGTTGTPR